MASGGSGGEKSTDEGFLEEMSFFLAFEDSDDLEFGEITSLFSFSLLCRFLYILFLSNILFCSVLFYSILLLFPI